MKKILSKTLGSDPVNVLLIGNNPMDMGTVLEKLNKVRSRKIITEIAFDIKSIVQRLLQFHPNFIFIDDNIGKDEMLQTVHQLSTNRITRDVPIAVLKNSNYHEALGSTSILDYLLKQDLSPDSLYHTLKNSLRFRKTQRYLYQSYQRRKNLLSKVLRSNQ